MNEIWLALKCPLVEPGNFVGRLLAWTGRDNEVLDQENPLNVYQPFSNRLKASELCKFYSIKAVGGRLPVRAWIKLP